MTEGWKIEYSKDGKTLIKANGSGSFVVPDTVNMIGAGAFESCKSLVSITIPESVKKIEKMAFAYCLSLSRVILRASITELQDNIFYDCRSLQSVTIPKSVEKIGTGAFQGCRSLSSIEIPDSVTELGRCAFDGCSSLSSVKMPVSLNKIEDGVFNKCVSLTQIIIPKHVGEIGAFAFADCSMLKSIAITDGNISIHDDVFGDSHSLSDVIILNNESSSDKLVSKSIRRFLHLVLFYGVNAISLHIGAQNSMAIPGLTSYLLKVNGIFHNSNPDKISHVAYFYDNLLNISFDTEKYPSFAVKAVAVWIYARIALPCNIDVQISFVNDYLNFNKTYLAHSVAKGYLLDFFRQPITQEMVNRYLGLFDKNIVCSYEDARTCIRNIVFQYIEEWNGKNFQSQRRSSYFSSSYQSYLMINESSLIQIERNGVFNSLVFNINHAVAPLIIGKFKRLKSFAPEKTYNSPLSLFTWIVYLLFIVTLSVVVNLSYAFVIVTGMVPFSYSLYAFYELQKERYTIGVDLDFYKSLLFFFEKEDAKKILYNINDITFKSSSFIRNLYYYVECDMHDYKLRREAMYLFGEPEREISYNIAYSYTPLYNPHCTITSNPQLYLKCGNSNANFLQALPIMSYGTFLK